MAKCTHCGKFIIGGKKQGQLRFCNDRCYQRGFLAAVADQAAPGVVAARLREIREEACPLCGGPGPIDICTSHTAWSAIVIVSWKDHPRLSCGRCGTVSIWRGIVFTFFLGWWNFPFGPVITPWQLMNGFKSLKRLPSSRGPSAELQLMVKLRVAQEIQSRQLGS